MVAKRKNKTHMEIITCCGVGNRPDGFMPRVHSQSAFVVEILDSLSPDAGRSSKINERGPNGRAFGWAQSV
jgi:hypothetical protein